MENTKGHRAGCPTATALRKAVQSKFDDVINRTFTETHRHSLINLVHNDVKPELFRAIDCLRSNKPTGLLIMGAVGCGKTCILNIIFEAYLETVKSQILNFCGDKAIEIFRDNTIYIRDSDGRSTVLDPANWANIRYWTHWQLVSRLRDWPDYQDMSAFQKEMLRGPTILLLDDFGRAYDDKAGWNLAVQDEFFDARWQRKLPTFITTNYNGPTMRSWEGWERIIDRIGDWSWIKSINVPGGSRRK